MRGYRLVRSQLLRDGVLVDVLFLQSSTDLLSSSMDEFDAS